MINKIRCSGEAACRRRPAKVIPRPSVVAAAPRHPHPIMDCDDGDAEADGEVQVHQPHEGPLAAVLPQVMKGRALRLFLDEIPGLLMDWRLKLFLSSTLKVFMGMALRFFLAEIFIL